MNETTELLAERNTKNCAFDQKFRRNENKCQRIEKKKTTTVAPAAAAQKVAANKVSKPIH